ncbi:GNAT family N-acetyltransferase [Cellulomonas sp. KRMCY2]|uniref:GNAT family N-acetyltransferase n=1 Tax=Cellulomonas sp. KRMCY2 TaxID=1304865 RepID=UPI0004AFBB61|nr:GNAT family N-acetyltransferase [Cellulomonas sp. KRMCY2]
MDRDDAPQVTGAVEIAVVPWHDDDAARLREEQQTELAGRYDGEGDIEPILPPEQMLGTVLVRVGGEVAGCGALRDGGGYGPGYGELKRMYVRPAFRRRGLSRLILLELERIAREYGLARLILETGVRQHEAIGLYRSSGYRRIAGYGPYATEVRSVCYARWLAPDAGTRVLVINGTVGAGKTTIAAAAAALLGERQVPHAWLDADVFRRVWPTPPGDPFAQQVVFAQLAAIAPNLAAHGYWRVLLADVVEDPADRERYEAAFDGADVAIVRLTVSEASRLARLTEREDDRSARDWHLARTVELDRILDTAGLDDVVVDNDGRPPREVAAEVLAAAGWVEEC